MTELNLNDNGLYPKFLRIFTHPVAIIICTLFTIVGLPLSVYFYFAAEKHPDLSIYVNPARAAVVDNAATSKLKIFLGDREIKSDVTAAQIALWNQGSAPIRSTDVLEKITIKTDLAVPILEASVRKRTRDVTHLAIDDTRLNEGIVGVSWSILEQGDGGILQIVYAGGPNVKVLASGIIEGQHEIRQLSYSGKIQSAAEQIKRERYVLRTYWAMLGVGVLMTIYFIYRFAGRRADPWGWLLVGANPIFLIGMSVWRLFHDNAPNPPFSF